MKVYALREMSTVYSGYLPIRGFFTALQEAKKQAKTLFSRSDAWDIVLFDCPTKVSHEMWIDLLNGDSLSSLIDGTVPRDYLVFVEVIFENAALKRYRKEEQQQNANT